MRQKLTRSLVTLLALFVVAGAPVAAQSIGPDPSGGNIDLISGFVRDGLTRGMDAFAREMGVTADLERIAWASSGSYVIAFAPMANLEGLTEADLARGVPYGVTYRTALNQELVSDYFLIRLRGEPGADTVELKYIDRNGNVVMRSQGSMETITDVASHPPKVLVGVQDNHGVDMPPTRGDIIIIDIDTWVFTNLGHWILGEHTHEWLIIF